MQNITILSLSIVGSFQKSPLFHLPSSTYSYFTNFRNINSKYFFSSFFMNRAYLSSSIIENSVFNNFILSYSVLSFSSDLPTSISNQSFYGDSIPRNNSQFYHTNYVKITNCKFMSITDNKEEQLSPTVGLCIYTIKNTTIDFCYFFFILSYRSGSCIFFDSGTNSTVLNSIFKSISQIHTDFDSDYLTGGAISYGRYGDDKRQLSMFSITENCCFEKILLKSFLYYGHQFGTITYSSNNIKANNLNFTNNEFCRDSHIYGAICTYFKESFMNSITFINIFDCKYSFYGVFSPLFNNEVEQNLSLSYANFINNSAFRDIFVFGLSFITVNGSQLYLSNIQCDSDSFFIGISRVPDLGPEIWPYYKPIKIIISNSIFKIPESKLYEYYDFFEMFFKVNQFDNQFEYNSFDLKITNDIISNFGYIKTSIFTASDLFTIGNSKNGDELNQANSKLELVFIPILSAISVIVFIFLLCAQNCKSKIKTKLINQFILDHDEIVDIENTGRLDDDLELNHNNDNNEINNSNEITAIQPKNIDNESP